MTISTSDLNAWNESLSLAVASVNSHWFPLKLETAIRQLLEFDLLMIYLYPKEGQASSLYHNAVGEHARILTDVYLEGPYLLDPFYGAVLNGKKQGFGAMRSLAPDQFYRSEFYRYHYVKTGIADEIGLFFPLSEDETAVLSITRQRPKRFFSEHDRKIFASINPVLQRFATYHWRPMVATEPEIHRENTITTVFDTFGTNILTAREKEIVELILKGHSSKSVSEMLGITSGTVKIHRKNAYEKLQISSQAELFSMFLDALSNRLSTNI